MLISYFVNSHEIFGPNFNPQHLQFQLYKIYYGTNRGFVLIFKFRNDGIKQRQKILPSEANWHQFRIYLASSDYLIMFKIYQFIRTIDTKVGCKIRKWNS